MFAQRDVAALDAQWALARGTGKWQLATTKELKRNISAKSAVLLSSDGRRSLVEPPKVEKASSPEDKHCGELT